MMYPYANTHSHDLTSHRAIDWRLFLGASNRPRRAALEHRGKPMKPNEHFSVASAFALFAIISALDACAANSVIFDNQSGNPAIVKLVGPTSTSVSVQNGKTETVQASAGHYYIKVRYGTSGNYVYGKGEDFDVTETATSSSEITITLHKVLNGNYRTRPMTETEFGVDDNLSACYPNHPTWRGSAFGFLHLAHRYICCGDDWPSRWR